jgi:putative MFS transporter
MADVVESFGLRWIHVGLLAVTWLLLLCPAAIIMATPYVLGSLRDEYGVSRAAAALVGSAVTLGAVIGTMTFGRLHDMMGRRLSHIFAAVAIGILASLHLALPTVGPRERGNIEAGYAFALLIALRVGLGIMFAGPASFAALYLIEFLPSQLRGFILTVCSAGWSAGTLYSIAVASAFDGNWRMVLAAPVPACIIATIALFFCPESPRWLFVVDRKDDGRRVMKSVFASGVIMPAVVPDPWHHVPKNIRVSKADEGKNQALGNSTMEDIAQLFSPKLRRTVIAIMMVQMAVNGASYAMLTWSADILAQLLHIRHAPYELFVYGEMVGWIGTLFAACLLDHLGRKLILVISLIATAGCHWSLTMVPRTYFWICTIFLCCQMVGGGIWPAMTAYTNECFPTSLRGTGGALVQAAGRGMAVCFAIFIGAVLDDGVGLSARAPPLESALCFTAGVSVIGAVGAMLIPHETANAKMQDI